MKQNHSLWENNETSLYGKKRNQFLSEEKTNFYGKTQNQFYGKKLMCLTTNETNVNWNK